MKLKKLVSVLLICAVAGGALPHSDRVLSAFCTTASAEDIIVA